MHGLKSAILAVFQKGLGWLCPVSAALKNPSQQFKNSFYFGCRIIPRKTVKLERARFSKVQSGKITVCPHNLHLYCFVRNKPGTKNKSWLSNIRCEERILICFLHNTRDAPEYSLINMRQLQILIISAKT